MTDAYAETDVWPNPPATHAPAPDRTESAPDASRVLGDVPTATDAKGGALALDDLADDFLTDWATEVGRDAALGIEAWIRSHRLASAAPAVSDGEGATSEAAERVASIWRESPKTRAALAERYSGLVWALDHLAYPASPVVASSATEAPQAPAEQEGLQLPPRPTVHDGTRLDVDGVTRCCGVRMTDLSPIDRVTMFASQVTCIAPSPRPDTADDEGGE